MADEDDAETGDQKKKKGGILGLLLPVILLVGGGGGGFAVTYGGLLDSLLAPDKPEVAAAKEAAKDVAYVPIEPFTVSLGSGAHARHLRFSAQLEVSPESQHSVTEMTPRIVDTLNTYLRAVDEEELDAPGAMVRLRGQMLRRIDVVLGNEAVRDLLIMEFVLN